jgi:hypothetical protein
VVIFNSQLSAIRPQRASTGMRIRMRFNGSGVSLAVTEIDRSTSHEVLNRFAR